MILLIYVERTVAASGKRSETAPIAWILQGRAFVIRDRAKLVEDWLPKFFPRGKFQSFTRKLYRWEFRQVNLPQETSSKSDKEQYFAHPCFQRDKRELMMYMRSVTAARTRRAQQEEKEPKDPPRSNIATAARSRGASLAVDAHSTPSSDQLVLPQGPLPSVALNQSLANLYAPQLAALHQYGPTTQVNPANTMTTSNLGQLQLAALGLIQIDPQVQHSLLLASLLRNTQAQARSPLVLPNPTASLRTHASLPSLSRLTGVGPVTGESLRISGETKQSPESDRDRDLDRLRRVAEMLFRSTSSHSPGQQDNSSSPQGGDSSSRGRRGL
jgi:hypothetical protein